MHTRSLAAGSGARCFRESEHPGDRHSSHQGPRALAGGNQLQDPQAASPSFLAVEQVMSKAKARERTLVHMAFIKIGAWRFP